MVNKSQSAIESALFKENELKTNKDNAKCLLVLAVILLICDILNEIGLFAVSPLTMRIGAVLGIFFYIIPVILIFWHSKKDLVYKPWHKYLIIAFAWLGTMVTCITLTHHTVIIMAVPIMIMAQYRDTKKLTQLAMVLGTLCVLLGVYGGYFWGCFDGNLLGIKLTHENRADLALRMNLATPTRMFELLIRYALPRELAVLSLTLLASKTSKRSNEILVKQAKLQSTVEKEMKRTNEIQCQIIDGMANLIENRDTSTGEHVKRTSFYVDEISHALQLKKEFSRELSNRTIDTIVRAAPLHDIGKIVIADRILQKPGKLTSDEYEEIKKHSEEGVRVIKNVLGNVEDDSFLRIAEEITGGHHERWDGNGYPKGLKGKEIPLPARIMAVADVFDALVSKRAYKTPMPPEEAFAIIESESGKQFDPEIVKAFCSLKQKILQAIKTED